MNRRFVFDVSTLFWWPRAPVGIVRAQFEIARWLLSHSSTVAVLFVRFSADRTRLDPVSNAEVERRLLEMDQPPPPRPSEEKAAMVSENPVAAPSDVPQDPQAADLAVRTKKLLKAMVAKATPPSQHANLRAAWNTYRASGAAGVTRKLVRKGLKVMVPAQPVPNDPVVVAPLVTAAPDIRDQVPIALHLAEHQDEFLCDKDVFLSMGLDWDHSNYELLYWLKKRFGFRFVGIFYDAIPIQHPEHTHAAGFPQIFFRHYFLLNYLADRVSCISNFSRAQYVTVAADHGLGRAPQLRTIHLGDVVPRSSAVGAVAVRRLPQRFILYVSSVESRKNHRVLLKTWRRALDEQLELPDLVCVGMRGWGVDDLFASYDADEELQKKVHFFTDVADDELVHIYRSALFCVFPSLVEGWGLGATEALSNGKLCLISTAPALVEATRGLMPSIAADDVDAWLSAILKYSQQASARVEVEQLIQRAFKPRSWSQFAEEFLEFAGGNR